MRTATIAFGAGVVFTWLVLLSFRDAQPVQAQSNPALQMPSSCSSGDVLIVDGSRLTCVSQGGLRVARDCSRGEFLVASSSGAIACNEVSSAPWGHQNLLPSCNQGATLESEGFGRWRCHEAPRH